MSWTASEPEHALSAAADESSGKTRAVLVAGAILLLGVGIRAALSPQFSGLDDAGYLDAARSVAQRDHGMAHATLFYLRVGMSYPLGLLIRAGLAPPHFWLLNTVTESATILILIALGWRLFGRRAGLIAGLLYACYPLAVGQATLFLPTVYQIASIALALWLLELAGDETTLKQWVLGGLSGVSLGLGYLVKEDVALLVPALVVVAFLTKYRPIRPLVAVCVGATVVLATECVLHAINDGNPFYRFAYNSTVVNNATNQVRLADGMRMQALWDWDAFLRPLFVMPYQVGAYWWCAVPAVVMALRRGGAAGRLLALLLLVVFAYLQFGSAAILTYVPLPKSARYTAILTPMLILLLAGWLSAIYRAGRSRVATALITGIVVTSVPCLIAYGLTASERTRNAVHVVAALKAHDVRTVYADSISGRLLRSLVDKRVEVHDWFQADFDRRQMSVTTSIDDLRGKFVFLDWQGFKVYTSNYGLQLPDDVRQVSREADVVWSGRAYPMGGWQRSVLEGVRSASRYVPGYVGRRIAANCADMLDNDEAALLRVRERPR